MDLNQYLKYSPYDAALYGKSEAERQEVFDKLATLSDEVHHFLTAPETAQRLADLVHQGLVPDSHATAIGKILFLACTGEVPITKIQELLEKLQVPRAGEAAKLLTDMLAPVIRARAAQVATPALRPMPAMTRPTETGTKPLTGQQTEKRNIIDLRQRP